MFVIALNAQLDLVDLGAKLTALYQLRNAVNFILMSYMDGQRRSWLHEDQEINCIVYNKSINYNKYTLIYPNGMYSRLPNEAYFNV